MKLELLSQREVIESALNDENIDQLQLRRILHFLYVDIYVTKNSMETSISASLEHMRRLYESSGTYHETLNKFIELLNTNKNNEVLYDVLQKVLVQYYIHQSQQLFSSKSLTTRSFNRQPQNYILKFKNSNQSPNTSNVSRDYAFDFMPYQRKSLSDYVGSVYQVCSYDEQMKSQYFPESTSSQLASTLQPIDGINSPELSTRLQKESILQNELENQSLNSSQQYKIVKAVKPYQPKYHENKPAQINSSNFKDKHLEQLNQYEVLKVQEQQQIDDITTNNQIITLANIINFDDSYKNELIRLGIPIINYNGSQLQGSLNSQAPEVCLSEVDQQAFVAMIDYFERVYPLLDQKEKEFLTESTFVIMCDQVKDLLNNQTQIESKFQGYNIDQLKDYIDNIETLDQLAQILKEGLQICNNSDVNEQKLQDTTLKRLCRIFVSICAYDLQPNKLYQAVVRAN